MSKGDVDVIRSIPSVELVSPEIIRKTKAIYNGKILDIRCVGVTNSFFRSIALKPIKARYLRKSICIMHCRCVSLVRMSRPNYLVVQIR